MSEEKRIVDGTESALLCPRHRFDPPRLVVKTNKATREQFLGCPDYPRCRHTQALPEHVKLTLRGAKRLL